MQLLKMKCISDLVRGDVTLEPENQEEVYMVKLENICEEGVYEATHKTLDEEIETQFWNYYLQGSVEAIDDEIYHYFMSNEQEPKVGETFVLDDIKYERAA